MEYKLFRAQYMAKDGPYRVKLVFRDGHWHCEVRKKNRFIGATMAGQTSSKHQDTVKRYAQRIIDKDKTLNSITNTQQRRSCKR